MTPYVLTRKADYSIENIYQYTCGAWGLKQARTYIAGLEKQFIRLSKRPSMGKLRPEIFDDLMSFRYESHIIFYRTKSPNQIEVIDVLHSREDAIKKLGQF